jgi:hypothetical protein
MTIIKRLPYAVLEYLDDTGTDVWHKDFGSLEECFWYMKALRECDPKIILQIKENT